MQTKFISKKKVAELQGMCDDYSRKTKSNIGFKIVAGLLVLGIPVITIIGCSKKKEEVPEMPDTGYEQIVDINDPVYQHQELSPVEKQEFENGLTKYLCEQTGLAINLATTESVQLSCDDKGNYLIMESSVVTEEGTKDCTVILEMSEEQAKVVNDHILMHNFSLSFPAELETLLEDESTTLVSVFDNTAQVPLYTGGATKENVKR